MTIWTSEHKSDVGRDYKLSIIDSEGGDLVGEMIVNDQGFTLKNTGKGRTLHNRIIGKSLTFTVQVENTDQEDFIESLATSAEGRYLVEVERGTDVIFRGGITTDSVEIDNAPKPYNFKLEAVDGVTLLKDVEGLLPEGTFFFVPTKLLDIMLDQLGLSFNASLYSISDSFLTVAMNWWSKEHSDLGQDSTGNALEKTRVLPKTYIKPTDELLTPENRVPISAYGIVEDICKAFNARIYYDEGSYHFEQYNLRESNASITRQVYNAAGTEITEETPNLDITIEKTGNAHMVGGKFSILPPLKSVTARYLYDASQSFLPADTPFEQEDPLSLIKVGEIPIAAIDLKLNFEFEIRNILSSTSGTQDYREIVFQFVLKVGDYYLSGSAVEMEWTTDTDAFFVITSTEFQRLEFPLPAPAIIFDITITSNVTTPPVVEEGDVEVGLRAMYRYFDDTTDEWVYEFTQPPNTVHTYFIIEQKLAVVSGDNNSLPVQFTATQNDGRDSQSISTIIGDGLSPAAAHALIVRQFFEDYHTTGWREGNSGDYLNLSELNARSVLSQRLKPVKIVNGTIYAKNDIIGSQNRLVYDNRKLLFSNSSFSTNYDEIDVEAVELISDETGVTSGVDSVSEESTGAGGSDPVGGSGNDPNDPPNAGVEGLITSEIIYANVAITEVPILEADDDYFITGDKIVIKDKITGYEHLVIVAAPLVEGDTAIIIESYTPDRNIAIYSPVQFAPGQIVNLRPKYQLFSNVTGSEVIVTEFDLPDESNNTNTEMSRRLRVWRQSQKLVYTVGYTVDSTNNKILFEWDLANEYVEVELL